MTDADAILLARTRRAYERGRLRHGLRAAAAVIPMAVLSLIACERPALTMAGALALSVVVAAASWRGQGLARGGRLGLLAGLPALLLPVLVGATGHFCGQDFCVLYPAACIVGGVAGGAAHGWRGPPSESGSSERSAGCVPD